MPSRLGTLLAFFKPVNLLATVLLIALGYGGYHVWTLRRRSDRVERERQELQHTIGRLEQQNAVLKDTVATLEAQVEQLRTFVARLSAESHVADVRIMAFHRDRDGVPVTTFEFTQRGGDGAALPARVFTVRGDEVYFDALVLKFADDHVKVGDPLRGKSLHLFRRVFGSAQEPREGPLVAASQTDGIPDAYRASPEASDFERRLWSLFWHWAAHPDEAEAEGVRVAQIEAVGVRPLLGATYRLTLEHDGGLNIRRTGGRTPQGP